ncbi:MAG: hypothetical protein ACRBCS_02950 [Cellvibrionaceae bacterium]
MATKTKDIVLKTGSYQDREGNQKNRYENVGSVMQGDDGGIFIIMKRTFNPAGAPNPDNKDSVLLSCFDSGRNNPAPQQNYQQNQQAPQQQGASMDDFDDSDIPF